MRRPRRSGRRSRTGGEFWEAIGDEFGAVEAYRRAHAAFVVFASWATSGAEGSGRMVDVNRVAEKLRAADEN